MIPVETKALSEYFDTHVGKFIRRAFPDTIDLPAYGCFYSAYPLSPSASVEDIDDPSTAPTNEIEKIDEEVVRYWSGKGASAFIVVDHEYDGSRCVPEGMDVEGVHYRGKYRVRLIDLSNVPAELRLDDNIVSTKALILVFSASCEGLPASEYAEQCLTSGPMAIGLSAFDDDGFVFAAPV